MSPVVQLEPMVKLTCDVCGEDAKLDGYDYAVYPASDIGAALNESCFRRVGKAVVCDDCPDDEIPAEFREEVVA